MTPRTAKGATLQIYGGSYTRPIVKAELLNLVYSAFHDLQPLLGPVDDLVLQCSG